MRDRCFENFVTGDTIDLHSFSATGAALLYNPADGLLQITNVLQPGRDPGLSKFDIGDGELQLRLRRRRRHQDYKQLAELGPSPWTRFAWSCSLRLKGTSSWRANISAPTDSGWASGKITAEVALKVGQAPWLAFRRGEHRHRVGLRTQFVPA